MTSKTSLSRADEPLRIQQSDQGQTGSQVCGTEKLLLIENDPILRELAARVLRTQGYTVLWAVNGLEGMRVAREHKDPPIRLVIMDFTMPQVSGKLMAEWLMFTYPDIKILFTSGRTDDVFVQRSGPDPSIAFLPKPYTPASLSHKVREMLGAQ